MAELIEGKMVGPGTEKAFLMEIDGREVWITKRFIEPMKGFKAIFPISDWMAWKKGLITEEEFNKRRESQNTANREGSMRDIELPEQDNLPF